MPREHKSAVVKLMAMEYLPSGVDHSEDEIHT